MIRYVPDTAHAKKYEALAQRIGIDALRALLPDPLRIRAALAAGDQHLNTINLAVWDRAAGCAPFVTYGTWPRLSFAYPWTPAVAGGLSLAERVCVLKHVATHHLEG